MTYRASRGCGIIFALIMFSTGSLVFAEDKTRLEAAQKFVTQLLETALNALQTVEDPQEKLRLGKNLMVENFDLDALARFSLGRYAHDISEQEHLTFRRVFFNYLTYTYIGRLAGVTETDYRIDVLSAEPYAHNDIIVHSKVRTSNGDQAIPLGWRVRIYGSKFRIIDFVVSGISMAVTQRSEFAAIIRKDGFEGLLMAMRRLTRKVGGDPDAPIPKVNVSLDQKITKQTEKKTEE